MNTNYFKEPQAGLKYTEGVVAGVSAAKTEDCQIFGEWITIICGNRRRMRFLNLDDGEYNPSIQFGWNTSDKVRVVYEKTKNGTNIIKGIKLIG